MGRRLLGAALALLASASLVFLLAATAPGDAALALAGEELAPGQAAELARLHGLDAPWLQRWGAWLWALARGDLGHSLRSGAPVAALIAERLPVTLALMLPALLLSTALGLAAGLAGAGLGPRGAALFAAAMTGAHALPGFLVAQLLVLGFALGLGWLPVQGLGDGVLGWMRHLALPVLALALHQLCFLALLARAGVASEMARPYALAARARGRGAASVRWRHALPNALAPIVTLLGLRMGALFAGAVIIETVFALPGLGRLAVGAALARDHPVLVGCVLVATSGIILANLLADAVLARLDPRRRA
ncbi:MAG: ABC transporter permease [Rubritepida sp.]|jgi:peptide/nickel transport system permease protein|nr:ABC transporter permease [Rubritepida sp.]